MIFEIFKPKWKHKDKNIRMKAVEELVDTADLLSVAKYDTDTTIRRIAINKLKDKSEIEKLISSEENYENRMVLAEKIENQSV